LNNGAKIIRDMSNLHEFFLGYSRDKAKVHRVSPSNLYHSRRVQALTWKTDQQKVYAPCNHRRLIIKKDDLVKNIEKSGIQEHKPYQTGALHLLKNRKLLRQTIQNIPTILT